MKQRQPRTLIVWGKGDPLFRVNAAHALKRDLPAAKLVVYGGGHFMLQEHAAAVAREIVAMFEPTGSGASVRGH